MKIRAGAVGIAAGVLSGLWLSSVLAQEVHSPVNTPADAASAGLGDLRSVAVPEPSGLSDFINSGAERKLQQLGKMLFWDTSVGSDNISCASCHFHAGVDNRTGNSVSPGLLHVLDNRDQSNPDIVGYHHSEADPDASFQTKGPGQPISLTDFPLVRYPGQISRNGDSVGPASDNSNDAISSGGVIAKAFGAVVPMNSIDECSPLTDHVFNDGFGANQRRVPPRNTPSVINAVFNAFSFWDGRANHYFNGQNVFGVIDPDAFILLNDGTDIVEEKVGLRLNNSSLASQAVGPPLSTFEESCGDGNPDSARTWQDVGKKLLRTDVNGNYGMEALANQRISRTDSLIGEYSSGTANGANVRYRNLIKEVFQEKYWKSDERRILLAEAGIDVTELQPSFAPHVSYPDPIIDLADPGELEDDGAVNDTDPTFKRYTLMEMNFPLFFGLAVQAYESLLVSDDTPFDRWMRNGRLNGKFNSSALRGLDVFVNAGSCANCHGGKEFTNASVTNFQQGNNLIEPMIMGDNNSALYDNGFYNIGVTPTVEDLGRGAKTGPQGLRALAASRQLLGKQEGLISVPHKIIGENRVAAQSEDGFAVCVDQNNDGFCSRDDGESIIPPFLRAAVDGAFKTPGLRNIALQGPYFHNGSVISLAQVVEFYDNGGNFCHFNRHDLDPDIHTLDLTSAQKRDLVAFLVSLTDDRVVRRKAPFDHPSISIPAGGAEAGTINIVEVGRSGVRRSADFIKPTLNVNHNYLGAMPRDFECSLDGNSVGG